MRKLTLVSILLAAACSSRTPAGPSADLATSSIDVNALPPGVTSGSGIVWGDQNKAGFGSVTITNTTGKTATFWFIAWKANDLVNQVNVAQIDRTLGPGQTATLTLAFAEQCDGRYQRDVYLDLPAKPAGTKYGFSDVGNYFYASPGFFYFATKCGAPPVTPPVIPPPPPPPPTCQDRTAINFGGLLPCIFGEGGIDVCPNLLGLQTTVPNGLVLVNGDCVEPPPIITACSGPFTYSGPSTFELPNAGIAEVNYVHANVSPLLVEQNGSAFAGQNTWIADGNYAVVLVQGNGTNGRGGTPDLYTLYVNVVAGASYPSPTAGTIKHISRFNCVSPQ